MGYYGWGGWAPYVSVAERKRKAEKKIKQLQKKGMVLEPINLAGRTITKTYWGKAWCNNLESYSDFSNRLPRGRTYVRNGSVIDLKITAGLVKALVHGSHLYEVTLDIAKLTNDRWQKIITACSGKIDSLVELLKGKFSKSVMEVIAKREEGLFPHPKEIKIHCSCPDYADVCKHVAAVFYGIGSKFDVNPELLFILRQVNHEELIIMDNALEALIKDDGKLSKPSLSHDQLSDIFGIDIDVSKTISDQLSHKGTEMDTMKNSALAPPSKKKKRKEKITKQKKPLKNAKKNGLDTKKKSKSKNIKNRSKK